MSSRSPSMIIDEICGRGFIRNFLVIEWLKRASPDNDDVSPAVTKSNTEIFNFYTCHIIRQDVMKRPQLNTPGHSSPSADLAQVAV